MRSKRTVAAFYCLACGLDQKIANVVRCRNQACQQQEFTPDITVLPWSLLMTVGNKRFLKSLRIAPDAEEKTA